MGGQHGIAGTLIPFAILGLILLLRMRNISRARPLREATLIVVPAIYLVAVGIMLVAMPPSVVGWAMLALGVALGGALGWQRARLMRLHLDVDTGRIMVRQSPAALILLMAVAAPRRMIGAAMTAPDASAHHAAMSASALLFTDALIGFGLGMIVAQRVELWRRAQSVRRG